MKPNHAIILAAGRGSRLGGLTTERPKCLVPVLGRPLLDWQADALKAAGIDTLGIVRGYQAPLLERPSVTLFDNPRWAETNMVRSLMCASAWLRQFPCIVSYADLIYMDTTVRQLGEADADLAITFDRNWQAQWEARFGDPLVDAETFAIDERNRVTDIGRKPTHLGEINGQFMGLLRFTPHGWSAVESLIGQLDPALVDRLDMTSLLGRLIQQGTPIQGVGITDSWFEVDSETDLIACEAALAHLRDVSG